MARWWWLTACLVVLSVCYFWLYDQVITSQTVANTILTPSKHNSPLVNEVTVVTAFINTGFQRRGGGAKYSHKTYTKWATPFHLMTNPVVAFFTDDEDIKRFKVMRGGLLSNITLVNKVNRKHTWAFSLYPKIVQIFAQKSYPKYHPYTVSPDYACAVNAKYEFLSTAVDINQFKTQYFAWMDYGYMRNLRLNMHVKARFHVGLPPQFNHSRVAYTEVFDPIRGDLTAEQVVRATYDWVAGGFFIGTIECMQKMAAQYKECVHAMVKLGWVSADQQVLSYMVQPGSNISLRVQIQPYHGTWHHLGRLCLREIPH